jgi:hypothetical protein
LVHMRAETGASTKGK